ncbi:hypothetical protein FDP41_002522 [Naegleria fowleri]|uniref:HNH domain-containing protein n=1 Tax=Naegleria fowleri TaxID=5763 RepID=A0A6A5BVR3_NAEFO|nr:uncharacterized protein FDP41_002522 [Naegleria fowleri]KAF0978702.1 hypothetical protein FDP41_002522 [Naegleria fowleri]CAG4714000.1 unnamed protein product [Naegleria fowleri]
MISSPSNSSPLTFSTSEVNVMNHQEVDTVEDVRSIYSRPLTLEEMIAQNDAEIDEAVRMGIVDYSVLYDDEKEPFEDNFDESSSDEQVDFEEIEEERKSWAKKKKRHGHATLKRNNYDDLNLYSDDMVLLAKIEQRKFNWYLNKGLAEQINENSIKLKFKPKGYGHTDDAFYMSKMDNICVVCGTDKELTRHHIVSFEYRKCMPEFVRSHSSHDICLLCAHCHEEYETEAFKLRKQISEQYNSPLGGVGITKNLHYASAKKAANALLKCRDTLPRNRVEELEKGLRQFLKSWKQCTVTVEPSNNDNDEEDSEEPIPKHVLEMILTLQVNDKTMFVSHGEGVIKNLKQQSANDEDYLNKLDAFCRMWRQHFVDVLKPKFMSPHWKVDKRIRRGEHDDPNKRTLINE